ncbi:MAG: tetratricopeptide repeat protein [Desulfuromonadaceae bacterium]|nr:tetratricopeptide repeat protein [Desulfuromonadaceae bacterium]
MIKPGTTPYPNGGTVEAANEAQLLSAIGLNPDKLETYLALGDLLYRKMDLEGAVAVYHRALSANPLWGEIYHNLGNTLLALRRFPEALKAYAEAGKLMPDFAECHVTAATVLQSMGFPNEALLQCEQALSLDPELAEAHWNRALALLQLGQYGEGWREFEWRWQKRGYTTVNRNFPQPRWQGELLNGRTILIHAEQAFGDVIMFSRFLPMVAARGGRVICECPAPLTRLINQVPGVVMSVACGEVLPAFDCHLPLLSLPFVLGVTLENLLSFPPALRFDRTLFSVWQQRTLSQTGLRVGIAWAGRPFPDPARSCPFHFLEPLGTVAGVTFVSLQIGSETDEVTALSQSLPLVILSQEISDFADTAALIRNLDLVITIDTAIAHLAGTLERPTWVMLPFAADWRWLLEREDSPWYPSVRLFRQIQAGNWSEVIIRIHAALSEIVLAGTTDTFEACYHKATTLLQLGNTEEAWMLLERARNLNADIPELYNALGVVAMQEGDLLTAEQLLLQAIARDPAFADPLINLGNIMFEAGRYQESADTMLHAVELDSKSPRGWQNLGVVFQGIGKIPEAFNCFKRALMLDPAHSTARWNLANLELLTGDYRKGWLDFEARFSKIDPIALRYQEMPRWEGSFLSGKTLMVYAEQGYGDTIQFARYLPLLHHFGGRILFEVPDRSLLTLLERLAGIDRIIVRGETPPSADVQIPLLSLPGIIRTELNSIPNATPYLLAPPERIAAWKEQIRGEKTFHVGLCWSGRPKPDPRRSCSLTQMTLLTNVAGVIFHSLQLGPDAEQVNTQPACMRLRDDTDMLTDFSETAALVSNLDLVISIDTAVAHLAGALGKPVWLLLPFAPDWRWLLKREDSPWYPTMRLFRQSRPGDWEEVMERVAYDLDTTVATYHDRLLQGYG